MGSFMHPSGPLSAGTYWRRRISIIVIVVVIIVLAVVIWNAASGHGSSEATHASNGSPSASIPAGVADCTKGSLSATLTATQTTFPSTAQPSFQAKVTNIGKTKCTFDTSQTGWTLAITSGSDKVFSSADCPPSSTTPQLFLLLPGQSKVFAATWNRTRSDSEQCSKTLPTPGVGTYRATLTAAGATSQPAVFMLSGATAGPSGSPTAN